MDFLSRLHEIQKKESGHEAIWKNLENFYSSYRAAVKQEGGNIESYHPLLLLYLNSVLEELRSPYLFEPFHKQIQDPFDYYQFGLDFFRPLVILRDSSLHNKSVLDKIEKELSQGDNVILFANHQVEPDPQAISLLLEESHPKLGRQIIYVAGHRVTTDPMSIPLSKGCNLLCIYSKKYIEYPPEKKEEKLQHNRKTLQRMSELLKEGGHCIYVAPSGGRDRPDEEGIPRPSPFDPQSIEMFYLMTKASSRKTHFYPLALATYNLLPPPTSLKIDLGEGRHAKSTPIHIAFGEELWMEEFPGANEPHKKERQRLRAEWIFNKVNEMYQEIVRDKYEK